MSKTVYEENGSLKNEVTIFPFITTLKPLLPRYKIPENYSESDIIGDRQKQHFVISQSFYESDGYSANRGYQKLQSVGLTDPLNKEPLEIFIEIQFYFYTSSQLKIRLAGEFSEIELLKKAFEPILLISWEDFYKRNSLEFTPNPPEFLREAPESARWQFFAGKLTNASNVKIPFHWCQGFLVEKKRRWDILTVVFPQYTVGEEAQRKLKETIDSQNAPGRKKSKLYKALYRIENLSNGNFLIGWRKSNLGPHHEEILDWLGEFAKNLKFDPAHI
jgi:hypothetical protein